MKTSECMVLSSCCGQQANFFSKMLTYKRAYSGVKIIIVRARPGPQLLYFLFSHRAQGKLGSRLYALSKALIAFRFCARIGPTEAQVLPCTPARNNVSIPSYRGAEGPWRQNVTRFRLANYSFHHAHTGISL